MQKSHLFLAVVIGCHVQSHCHAQLPDLTEMTLNFENVTFTNLNQTVAESPNLNQKDIDFADFDNDGDLDVVIAVGRSSFGQRRNKLYRNDNGVLNEVSGLPVIEGFSFTDTARSAFFDDYDDDGWPDIIVVCDSNSGTQNVNSPGTTKFFRNVGGVQFVNESQRLDNISGSASDAASADFDNNGLADLVMVNGPNVSQDSYARNNINGIGPGQFQLVTTTDYPSEQGYADNGEAADMNGDGWTDLLIANPSGMPSYIYYNNNLNAGAGPGDFRYESPGSQTVFPGTNGLDERGLFPADFNNDGRMDFYSSNQVNKNGELIDFVMLNVGNDEFNRAEFVPVQMPDSTNSETMKVRMADFDRDGRTDMVVMSEFRRPQIFRNTSENGGISFVEWTPSTFDFTHRGWLANGADILGNARPDVLVGALANDHLFENSSSQSFSLGELTGGIIPKFHNQSPINIVGTANFDETIVLTSNELPPGANVSVLLRSFGDMALKVTQNGNVLGCTDRVGHGTDEAIQLTVPESGSVQFEIEVNAIGFDGNADGEVNLLDVSLFVGCLTGANKNCEPFDLFDNGDVNLLLVQPFLDALTNAKNEELFVIEFLSRSE